GAVLGWSIPLLTLGFGVVGALAARSLHLLLANLVLVSVGTLLAGIALGTPQALSAALFYLVHSTWVAGGLFLLADLIARQRGVKQAELVQGPALQNPHLLGGLFFLGAMAVAGLPPLSGFIGKLLLLRAVEPGLQMLLLWPVLLVGSLGCLIALSRAGSTLFWRVGLSQLDSAELDLGRLLACIGLLALSPLLVVLAAPVLDYLNATAAQLLDLQVYRQLVLPGAAP
ncbi:MAG TPA: proton-conducting transporter membrane subunit, partial [Pseudomonas sp.]|nr:proton-conducting transporter membrane subunit [Pseudomonas sp.]